MCLKSTKIQRLKSSTNKLVSEFRNDVTGIVDPDGNGKSNVTDVVRWVLGEQRIKQLRSVDVQDAILAGIEMRKPQGFAYVAIAPDNGDRQLAIDYDQVTVPCRLCRSGESKYMINGNACRLKDINELFYDMGTGGKGYSIIGQGQIDRILSGRPEERRGPFDEATSTIKFKRRKAIVQKKLEDEQANLVRVSDILSELERRAGPLERRSEIVREYLQLKDSLKIYDANLFLMETERASTQLEEVKKCHQALSGDMEDTDRESERLKAGYEELEQALADLKRRMATDRDGLSQGTTLKGSLEGQINILREQIHTKEINQEHLERRRDATKGELATKNQQLAPYRGERKAMGNQVRGTIKRQEEVEARLGDQDESIHRLKEAIERAETNIIQALNEGASLTARQQWYETMLEQMNLQCSEVSRKLLRFKSDESVQGELIGGERALLDQLSEELEKKQFAAQEVEDALFRAEQEPHRLNRDLNDTQQECYMAYTKLESLKNLAGHYDGCGNSIRRVMEVRDRVHGIRRVAADIITTNQKHKAAIETALGGSIQNIVTDSEATARQLIEYPRKDEYGGAAFLPLANVNGKQTLSQLAALKEKRVLGLASDLVQVDSRYEGLARYLLDRVVVTDTIDSAIALARKYRYSLRTATLEGELLGAGGSMTGGALRGSNDLLGRRKEIEELENTCNKTLIQVGKIQKELNLEESMAQEKEGELEKLRASIQSMAIQENIIRMNISQPEGKKAEIAELSTDLMCEHGQLEEQVKETSENRTALTRDSRELERVGAQANQEIEDKTVLLEIFRKERETCAAALSALQVEAADLRQKQDFIRGDADRVSGEIEKLTGKFDSLTEGAGNSEQVIEGKCQEIAHLGELIQNATVYMRELEQVMAGHKPGKEEISSRQKAFLAKREEPTARLTELGRDMFRIRIRREELEEKLEVSTAYMQSEYEMTYSMALELKREEYRSVPEVRKLIDELKSKIKGLGNIGVGVIEDYKEVLERYEFTRTQHEDLITAQTELEKIIEEPDIGMQHQFGEKSGEIRAEFGKTFKELFGGGRDALELMEDEDILEAGIQITTRPPSKKPQNMVWLPGGEKALAAIFLLFATQDLKLPLFCLLDEIEAALDDSNMDRFAGYPHKPTRNTQFIAVTHRGGTIVSADRLYGIAMQEKGVSTLISVNLITDDLDK